MKKVKINLSHIFDFMAYVGTALVAISLMLSLIVTGVVGEAFAAIGQAIAYIVTMIVACSFVKRKKHVAWLICYIVFVVAIIVLYILGLK